MASYLGDPIQEKWYSTVGDKLSLGGGGPQGTDWRQVMIDNNWSARPVDGQKEADGVEEVPEVFVEGSKRRDAESFAARLQSEGIGSDADQPEYLAYARLDASALLTRICKDKPGLLQALQEAIIKRDLGTFVDALEEQKGAKQKDISDLRAALKAGNSNRFADVLRGIAMPDLQRLVEQHYLDHEEHWGTEVANGTDPIMGNERRAKGSLVVTCYDKNRYPNQDMLGVEPVVHGRPKDWGNIGYAVLELGYDHDKWEEECLHHAYLYCAGNAVGDMIGEANGMGCLDRRIIGDRYEAGGMEAANFWGGTGAAQG